MSEALVLRARFAADDRTLTVLAEPWFDASTVEWTGRYVFLPLDRSLPHAVISAPQHRATRRDELLRRLQRTSDRALTRALRDALAALAAPAEE